MSHSGAPWSALRSYRNWTSYRWRFLILGALKFIINELDETVEKPAGVKSVYSCSFVCFQGFLSPPPTVRSAQGTPLHFPKPCSGAHSWLAPQLFMCLFHWIPNESLKLKPWLCYLGDPVALYVDCSLNIYWNDMEKPLGCLPDGRMKRKGRISSFCVWNSSPTVGIEKASPSLLADRTDWRCLCSRPRQMSVTSVTRYFALGIRSIDFKVKTSAFPLDWDIQSFRLKNTLENTSS